MQQFTVMAETDDGAMLADAFVNARSEAGIVVYMDVFGIREDLRAVCRAYAERGFNVVLPNLFHRLSPSTFPPVRRRDDPMPEEAMAANRATTVALTVADTDDLLHALDDDPRITATQWSAVGYCMGGRHAIAAAAAYPERISVAASIHGSRLVDDTGHSAHRQMLKVQGGLYFAFCREDHACPPEDRELLIAGFGQCAAEVSYDIFGAAHGFAIPGRWCSDPAAAGVVLDRTAAMVRRHTGVRRRRTGRAV